MAAMQDPYPLSVIARMQSDFDEKFGIPRQSGIAAALVSTVVFEPAYRDPSALRGLADFSHIWLLWGFSKATHPESTWSPTVRPPRLGGNRRMGVFATRSPFRPNPIGLSAVRLLQVLHTKNQGPVLQVAGADLLNGTPIFDIKPYLPYADAHPEATGGFVDHAAWSPLSVEIPPSLLQRLPPDKHQPLQEVLAQDPRPPYHQCPDREYVMAFAGFDIRFTVSETCLTVTDICQRR